MGKVILSKGEIDSSDILKISKQCNIAVEEIEDVYTCTHLQEATIIESVIHAGASVFQFVLNLAPYLELDRFCTALQRVVSLNPILRTRFADYHNGYVQVITKETHHTQRISGDLDEYLRLDKAKPLSLGMSLLRSAICDRKLVVTVHHGIMDHASLTPLFEDVLSIYYEREPPKRVDFKDFVMRCINLDELAAKAFWEGRFKGQPAIYPRIELGYVPLATQIVTQDISISRVDKDFSAAHIPSYIEVAWALTASTYCGNESVAFGMVLSGRTSNSTSVDEATTMGPTIAVLPVQVEFKHTTTLEGVLKDSAAARRQLQAHSALQYGLKRIRAVSDSARVASGFQTLLNIRPRWYDPKEDAEISFDSMDEPHGAFALAISCDLGDDNVSLRAVFDPEVIGQRQIHRVLHQFEHYLQSLIAAPRSTKLNQIPRLNTHDLSEIIRMNSELSRKVTFSAGVHGLFVAKAKEVSSKVAVSAHDGQMTYSELDDITERLAQDLRKRGVAVGSAVALIFEKSLWMIVAVLGILKAGGACVPISISDPKDRKSTKISQSGVTVILTSNAQYHSTIGLAPKVQEISPETILCLPVVESQVGWVAAPGSLAYVLWQKTVLCLKVQGPAGENSRKITNAAPFHLPDTSGSTGLPKGVLLEHQNLTSLLECCIRYFDWLPNTRVLQFASYVWDMSIAEIWCTLLSGSCLCIPSEQDRESDLAGYMSNNHVNCAILTPTVIRTLLPAEVPGLKYLVSAGEAVSPEITRVWGKDRRFYNAWGPCEGSFFSAVGELTPSSPYPESIGNPINNSLWIVNPKNSDELAPIGAIGEIYIEGPGVARGYLKDEAKTKTAFVKPPLWAPTRESGTPRFFRTGDLAKYNEDGSICFIGRQDTQVKIRGQRLELGEVESAVTSCSDVRDAFVTTKISEGRTELVAVVCLADPALPSDTVLQDLEEHFHEASYESLRAIRDYTRAKLPPYMVPTVWLAVEKLPRTISEKIDRLAISQYLKTKSISSARTALEGITARSLTPPRTASEKLLCSIWSSVLSLSEAEVGRESLFMHLGGDSITAMQIVSKARKQGLRISMQSLFSDTLASIAETAMKAQDEMAPIAPNDNAGAQRSMIKGDEGILSELGQLAQAIESQDIEAIVPATHGQVTMIAAGATRDRGYHIDFHLGFKPSLQTDRLRKACDQVLRNHSILRTVFVRYKSVLQQVILKNPPVDMVVKESKYTRRLSFDQGRALACFHLISDGQGCQRLTLEIHHALYDAISLGLIFQDLGAAYLEEALTDGPNFHTWVSHVQAIDSTASKKFWDEVLRGSSMPYLVPEVAGGRRGYPLDEQVLVQTSLQNIKTSYGTPSSALKAAWSLLISLALNTRDVVFGEVSANRFLPFPDMEKVKGPCVNQVPVRARLNSETTLASLIAQIQDLSVKGMPFHHLDTGTILADCSPWPECARFSTALVYQNHDSIPDTFRIGETQVDTSGDGKLGDSTDIHVIAVPRSDAVEVELRYSSHVFPSEQIQWIAQTLDQILEVFPSSLGKTLAELETDIRSKVNSYTVPTSSATPAPLVSS
ncbi:putative aminoadipate-semialdehyde dehydrogenase [Xylariaceae sp. FL1272]|nr:putative aminoadipate-semialdehyde dehydrogenase [Xylariaceae sp. FL1272]